MTDVITGESLRYARERADMTQQQVADSLGMSLRTIGNWERSSDSIPQKHWRAAAELLPLAEVEVAPSGGTSFTPEQAEKFFADMRASSERFMQLREHGCTEDDLAQLQARLYRGAIHALDFVEDMLKAGVATRLVREMASAISSAVIDAGTVTMLSGAGGFDPVQDIVFRAAHLDEEARKRPKQERTLYTVEGMYTAADPTDKSDVGTMTEDELREMPLPLKREHDLAAGDMGGIDDEDTTTP